jgi:hypothetical protein
MGQREPALIAVDTTAQLHSISQPATLPHKKTIMLLVDRPTQQVTAYFEPARVQAEQERFWAAQSQRTWRLLRKQFTGGAPRSSEGTACKLIAAAIRDAEAWVKRLVTKHSRLRWLWMLRRMPTYVFEGSLTTTLGYDTLLAEVLTGNAGQRPGTLKLIDAQITYDLNRNVLDDLCTLCMAARYLSELHRAFRWAAKGAAIEFSPHTAPLEDCSDSLRESVTLYDRRFEVPRFPSSRLGTGTDFSRPRVHETDDLLGVLTIKPDLLTWPKELLGRATRQSRDDEHVVLSRFLPLSLSSREAKNLGAADSRQDVALIILLRSGWLQMLHHIGKLHPILTRGYFIFHEAPFRDLLEQALADLGDFKDAQEAFALVDAPSVMQALSEIEGTAWPLLAGPVIRREGSTVCVDMAAATWRFLTLLPFSSGGEMANLRGAIFEKSVQAAVDGSAWRPPDEVRQLRGRTLRIAGQGITDIDAIAASNETVVLLSCKSIVYHGDLDAGIHRAVRNAADNVERAVAEWQTKIARIREHPTGDNYDLSRFQKIVGVVCTPSPIWVPLGPATAKTEIDLLAACSFPEVINWARSAGAPVDA